MFKQVEPFLLSTSWLDIVSVCIRALGLIVSIWLAFLASRLAKKSWLFQKKEERNMQIEATKYQKCIEAHTATWKLLAYLTKQENSKNIILYQGTSEHPKYYFIKQNAVRFIENLSTTFYEEGHGLFLKTEVKDKLYHVRSIVYGFLLKCKNSNNTESQVLIENINLVATIEKNYEELRSLLREIASGNLRNTA